MSADNFFLLGHSWGGILAIEYALRYQQHLRGLIVSNMVSSRSEDISALAEIQALEASNETDSPRYMELLLEHHYVHHVLRMPLEEWPDPVNRAFDRLNQAVYVPMQGPSSRRPCKLAINVPLTIGAGHDTMDPAVMEDMAKRFPKGRYLFCPNGSHMAMYDDQETYYEGLIKFLVDPTA